SVLPPAANGTMTVTGFDGQTSWANAVAQPNARVPTTNTTAMRFILRLLRWPLLRYWVQAASLLRLLEKSRVGRRLVFPRRHQVAVRAQVVALLADDHPGIPLRANELAPDRSRTRIAIVVLGHGPRPRQGIVDGRNLVIENVGVCL